MKILKESIYPNRRDLVNAIKDVWDKDIKLDSTLDYLNYFKDNYNWDIDEISDKYFNDAWDEAVASYNISDDEEEIFIDGIKIETKEDAAKWLKSKTAKYGNTYHFPKEDRDNLNRLIDKFGNSYFWMDK